MLLEVLFDPAGLVVAADLRIDSLGDHLGAPRCPGSVVDSSVKDQRHRLRAAHVEVIADELLEKRPPGRRPVKHPGVGDLELAKRQLVDVPGAQVGTRERGGQPLLPAPQEALYRAGAKLVADPLQRRGVLTITKAVVQRGVADAEPLALP